MKIAVFYLIGQYESWWNQDFYQPQILRLQQSGLADHIDHFEIHVAGGHEPLPMMLPETRRITYHRDLEQAENQAMRDLWRYAQDNPGHRVLWFHSIGLSHHREPDRQRKRAWGEFLTFCNIDLWRQCQELLNFYDCVGADYINYASFGVPHTRMWAPHYSGNFWWATTNYVRGLDPCYLDQEVPWQRYLGELWIGSNDPRAFMIYRSAINPYVDTVQYDSQVIRQGIDQHIQKLQDNTDRY